jgi:recombination protein RecR
MLLPEPILNLINALSRLPGIGPKSASRLAFFLLRGQGELTTELAEALQNLQAGISDCQTCFNITTAGRIECEICSSDRREARLLCVVEEPLDVLALERTESFTGRYHVLHGALSPVEGITPEDLKIRELIGRVQAGGIDEIILATNPSMEGDYTAAYLSQQLRPLGVRLTRLARGLPMGGDLEYADQNTLRRALDGRQDMAGNS